MTCALICDTCTCLLVVCVFPSLPFLKVIESELLMHKITDNYSTYVLLRFIAYQQLIESTGCLSLTIMQ